MFRFYATLREWIPVSPPRQWEVNGGRLVIRGRLLACQNRRSRSIHSSASGCWYVGADSVSLCCLGNGPYIQLTIVSKHGQTKVLEKYLLFWWMVLNFGMCLKGELLPRWPTNNCTCLAPEGNLHRFIIRVPQQPISTPYLQFGPR